MKQHWLVQPKTIRLLWLIFVLVLGATVVAGFFVHGHAYFWIDGSFAFNAWYGFVTCVAMIVVAKGLAIFLKRSDTYYDSD